MTPLELLAAWKRANGYRWFSLTCEPSYGTDMAEVVLVDRVDKPPKQVTQKSTGDDAEARAILLALERWLAGDFDKSEEPAYEECGKYMKGRGNPDQKCRRRAGHPGFCAPEKDDIDEGVGNVIG